jgi:hypothetical protein
MTQNRSLAPIKRLARYRYALYGVAPSEVFWEVQGDVYRRVVATSDWDWRNTPFRGIRQHPWSDVLAFARGHQTRVRFAQTASTWSDSTPW